MLSFNEVQLKNNTGKVLFKCYYNEGRGICYIQIPSNIDAQFITQKVKIIITGPEYSIGKPELEIRDGGKKLIIRLQLCSRPFIRTTLSNEWLRDNVEYDYCEDPDYIRYLCDAYGDVMKIDSSGLGLNCLYNDYLCCERKGSKIVGLKNMWRLCGQQWNLNDEEGRIFFNINYGLNYDGDDNCLVTIPDDVTKFLIDHDTKIEFVGPIPGSTEPQLVISPNSDRMRVELMNKYPLDIRSSLPDNWVNTHITINWNPHLYNFLDKYFKDGTLVNVTSDLLKSLGI